MPLVDPNLESRKHMRVVDLDFVYDFQQTIECIAVVSFCYHLNNPKHHGTDSQGRLN